MKFCIEVFTSLDMDIEIMLFLSSLVAFFILKSLRKTHIEARGKNMRFPGAPCNAKVYTACDSNIKSPENQDAQNVQYAQIDKALCVAFDNEDYEQVLKCWNALKRYNQCPATHLLQVVKAMQLCSKGAHFIVMELRAFVKAHPQSVNIGLINDILDPLARRLDDDAQLVDLIVRMLPSINVVKDIRTYEILLAMHVARKSYGKAQEIITEMRSMNVEFTPCALVAVLTIALQLGNFEVVLKAFAELKPAWEIRSTWAVSPFALQRHKSNMLWQIVELACEKRKLHKLLPALVDISLPSDVATTIQGKCASWSDIELSTMIKLLCTSDPTPHMTSLKDMLSNCLGCRSKASKAQLEAASDASTSEGSRSDSEDDISSCDGFRAHGVRAPPGLPPPLGF